MKLSVHTATTAGNVLAFTGAAGRFTIKRDLRERVEDAIERLIAMLDALDGDADFEPGNDDEPSMGWSYSFDGVPVPPAADGGDDRELDEADAEDGGDREPSLGWRGHGRGAGRRECVEDLEGDTGNRYAH